jgi:putative two-component system response regulator
MADAAPYLVAHGHFQSAMTASELMFRFAEELGRKELIRQAENYRGIIHKAIGNLSDAVVHMHNSLMLAQEIGAARAEALSLHNLGVLFFDMGLYREAEACFHRVHLFEGSEFAGVRSSAYHNLATVYSRTGRHEDAIHAAQQSFIEIQEPTTIHECFSRAMREACFIYFAVEREGPEVLRGHLDDCRKYATRCSTKPAHCFLRLATALCTVCEGDYHQGISIMTQVLEEARYIPHAGLVEDTLAAMAWAHETCAQPEKALECVKSLIEFLANKRQVSLAALNDSPLDMGIASDFVPLKYEAARLEVAATKLEAKARRLEMLQQIAMAATLRDDPSGHHGCRVGKLAALLAAELKWAADRCYQLDMAARLHDIGKCAIPDHILLSSLPLKNCERAFVESHPEVGSSLLIDAVDPDSRLAEYIALFHHEHWNGNGYPRGLSGTRIPIAARIVAIADVFDALTHGRPYADAWPIEKACDEIRSLSGVQFDPDLVEPFISLISRLTAAHGDLDKYLQAAAEASPFLAARKKIEAMIMKDREHLNTAA